VLRYARFGCKADIPATWRDHLRATFCESRCCSATNCYHYSVDQAICILMESSVYSIRLAIAYHGFNCSV
jgi:hypothetical protein